MRWRRRGWGWEGSWRAKRVVQEKARAGDQRHQSLAKRDPRWGGWEKRERVAKPLRDLRLQPSEGRDSISVREEVRASCSEGESTYNATRTTHHEWTVGRHRGEGLREGVVGGDSKSKAMY